jgi:hypothetical protein
VKRLVKIEILITLSFNTLLTLSVILSFILGESYVGLTALCDSFSNCGMKIAVDTLHKVVTHI